MNLFFGWDFGNLGTPDQLSVPWGYHVSILSPCGTFTNTLSPVSLRPVSLRATCRFIWRCAEKMVMILVFRRPLVRIFGWFSIAVLRGFSFSGPSMVSPLYRKLSHTILQSDLLVINPSIFGHHFWGGSTEP